MVQIKRFSSTDPDFNAKLDKLLAFENAQDDAIDTTAANILADIRRRKDAALIEYTNRFDRLAVTSAALRSMTTPNCKRRSTMAGVSGFSAFRAASLAVRLQPVWGGSTNTRSKPSAPHQATRSSNSSSWR